MIKPIKPACGEERIPLQAGDFLFCMQRWTCVAAACIMHAGEERPRPGKTGITAFKIRAL